MKHNLISRSALALILIAILSGVVRLKQRASKGYLFLFAVAAAGGLSLIIISQSGQTAVTIIAILVITGVWIARAHGTRRNLVGLIAVVLASPNEYRYTT